MAAAFTARCLCQEAEVCAVYVVMIGESAATVNKTMIVVPGLVHEHAGVPLRLLTTSWLPSIVSHIQCLQVGWTSGRGQLSVSFQCWYTL